MNRIKEFAKEKWFYIAALLAPWIIALVHSFLNDTWVTGNGNIAVGDLQAQVIPFAYELWDKFHLHQSLDFTWHVIDGIDFHTMTGYLVSPFTMIMLILPRHMIPDFIQFSMIAKWSLCAFTTVYFFYNTRFNKLKEYKELLSLFLGLCYTLGNGIMSYIGFIQFMDVMICFPILLLLVEKMCTKDNTPWKLYYMILVWCMISNAYPTFQICVFLAMWFVFQMCGDEDKKIKRFCVFSLSSIAAAVTNSWIIRGGVGAAGERIASDGVDARIAFVSKPLISLWEFTKQFFVLEPVASVRSYCPNIYMTVTAAFLLLLFPIVKIEKKRKVCILLIFAFLVVSFFEGHLNLLWHMMNIPNGVYNRFMFIFVFFALFVVLLILQNLEAVSYKVLIPSGVIAVVLFAYTMTGIKQFNSILEYLVTPLIVCFIIILFVLFIRKSFDYKQFLYVIAVLGMAEIVISSYSSFSYYDGALCYGENGLVDQAYDLLKSAELDKGERIVSLTPSPDIGMITNQNADAGFLSALNTSNKALHDNLGMASNSSVEFGTRGASPVINQIFNIRYSHGESEMICSDSELENKDRYLQLYRTNRLAGLGYMVNSSIVDWNSEGKNCFQYQNDFIKKAVDGDSVFASAKGNISFTDLDGNETAPDEEMLKYGLYQYSLEKYTHDEKDSRRLCFVPEEDMDLYMFFYSAQNLTNYISIDGEVKHIDARQFKQSTYHIGNVKKGQEIIVLSVPSEKTIYGSDYTLRYLFASFDEEAFASAYEKLSKNAYDIEEEQANYIKGTINADESGIMMTSIPLGFEVRVDGEITKCECIGGTFIGVPIEKGSHEVEFKYVTGSRKKGYTVTFICIAIFIIISAFDTYRCHLKKKDDLQK